VVVGVAPRCPHHTDAFGRVLSLHHLATVSGDYSVAAAAAATVHGAHDNDDTMNLLNCSTDVRQMLVMSES